MPGGDRTGPQGAGPMTGRAAGYCAGWNVPGYANPGVAGYGRGGGWGWGRGGGRGWRHRRWFHAAGLPPQQQVAMGVVPGGVAAPTGVPPAQTATPEVAALREQVDEVAGMLRSLKRRLDRLESGTVEQSPPKANT